MLKWVQIYNFVKEGSQTAVSEPDRAIDKIDDA